MASLTLLIIRHAEKPGSDEPWPGPGSEFDATPDPESLVIRGWERAGAWTALFGAGLGGTDYPAPAAVAAFLRSRLRGYLRTTVSEDDMEDPMPVIAELDKLESMLSEISTENSESAKITARLEALTSKWKEIRERVNESTVTGKLKSSTDDEVFDFIGKELGIFWNEQ